MLEPQCPKASDAERSDFATRFGRLTQVDNLTLCKRFCIEAENGNLGHAPCILNITYSIGRRPKADVKKEPGMLYVRLKPRPININFIE